MRRIGLAVVLALSLASPFPIGAQPAGRVARVGELVADPLLRQTFHQGLQELGYVAGRNIVFEVRDVYGAEAWMSKRAAELVSLRVDVILVDTTPALQAMRKATNTIPIIMAGFGDP